MKAIKKFIIKPKYRSKINKFISWFLIISSILFGIATYIAMTPSGDSNRYLVLTLLNIDLVLIVALVIVVTRNLIKLWSRKKNKQLGSQLHTRIVVFFSFLAAAPAVIVAIFGAIFFTVGIENWFSSRVEAALNKSESVANAYLIQGQRQIGLEAIEIANIVSTSNLINNNTLSLEKLVNHIAYERKLTEVVILSNEGELLAKNELAFLFDSEFRIKMLNLSRESGELVVNFSDIESEKLVSAVIPVDSLSRNYLFISKFKDISVVKDINDVKKAVSDYRGVEVKENLFLSTCSIILFFFIFFNASFIEITGTTALYLSSFFIILLIIVLFMFGLTLSCIKIFIGLNFANGIVTPIKNLASAAEKVSDGNLDVRVPDIQKRDEISNLSRIFNNMTEQLYNQRTDLLRANTQLESRRRFTETVLSGVTAGVIGIDKNERIFLPNKSAIELLNLNIEKVVGKKFIKIIPEMSDLLKKAKKNPEIVTKGQIDILIKNNKLTLMTQVTVEKNKNKIFGYVVTFDDMTELLQAQRVAAWSDVARRIAHEIKNPLTPIQLAAERLKKKYSTHIKKEPNIFDSCINTIIRQVDGMRNMVNEFSSFARMPSAKLKKTDLTNLVNDLGSLSLLSRNDIEVIIDVPSKRIYAMVDGNQIRQALFNLISNSINSIDDKNFKNSSTSVSKKLIINLYTKEDTICISVSDNGLGLPHDKTDSLMEPYVTTREEGTGLGLAIVKKIMEDHKGTFTLRNLDEDDGAISAVLELDFETIVFGHGPNGDRGSIVRQIAYYDDLQFRVAAAIEAGMTENEAAEVVRSPDFAGWSQYSDWYGLNVRGMYRWLATRNK